MVVSSVQRHGTRTATIDSADAALYVIHFKNNGGFVIMAADRRQPATLYAISDEGAFPNPETLRDGALKFIFSRIGEMAAALRKFVGWDFIA